MSLLEGLPTVQVVRAGRRGEDESKLPVGSPRNGFPWPELLQREWGPHWDPSKQKWWC